MAYRGVGMVELRELVRRWQAGEGVRAKNQQLNDLVA